ncbi:hypothetical protein B0H16DRAFT_502291 [Mycena metata]|uniref:Uncharacterized protein n=1 Tax=Mycena metata TaxID=1033252 RepID=A0AAD7JHY2_9AGAR|nr:hypothetical protein B0H16DRAFT_502291 [Mycena metata]
MRHQLRARPQSPLLRPRPSCTSNSRRWARRECATVPHFVQASVEKDTIRFCCFCGCFILGADSEGTVKKMLFPKARFPDSEELSENFVLHTERARTECWANARRVTFVGAGRECSRCGGYRGGAARAGSLVGAWVSCGGWSAWVWRIRWRGRRVVARRACPTVWYAEVEDCRHGLHVPRSSSCGPPARYRIRRH